MSLGTIHSHAYYIRSRRKRGAAEKGCQRIKTDHAVSPRKFSDPDPQEGVYLSFQSNALCKAEASGHKLAGQPVSQGGSTLWNSPDGKLGCWWLIAVLCSSHELGGLNSCLRPGNVEDPFPGDLTQECWGENQESALPHQGMEYVPRMELCPHPVVSYVDSRRMVSNQPPVPLDSMIYVSPFSERLWP